MYRDIVKSNFDFLITLPVCHADRSTTTVKYKYCYNLLANHQFTTFVMLEHYTTEGHSMSFQSLCSLRHN